MEEDAVGCTMCSFSHMKSSMVAMTVGSYTHRTHQPAIASSAVLSQSVMMTAEWKWGQIELATKQDVEGCFGKFGVIAVGNRHSKCLHTAQYTEQHTEQQPQDILNGCKDRGLLHTHWNSSAHDTFLSKAVRVDESRVEKKLMQIQKAACCVAAAMSVLVSHVTQPISAATHLSA